MAGDKVTSQQGGHADGELVLGDVDQNCITYWLPKLVVAGIPVPRTEIVETDVELPLLLDGRNPTGFVTFLCELGEACDRIGYPVFLRTGHTSGKHDWKDTCYCEAGEVLGQHVANLVERSVLAGSMGLPIRVWVAREFLKLRTAFLAFNGMPVALEYRAFIYDEQVACVHPYWPSSAIRKPDRENWRMLLDDLYSADKSPFRAVANQVAKVFDGYWSVDVCETVEGDHYVTDMALGRDSWHWPGCAAYRQGEGLTIFD